MFGNLFRLKAALRQTKLEAHNENDTALVRQSDMRALATGAALATSLDTSPAVLVGIYDYAHRYRDAGRRRA